MEQHSAVKVILGGFGLNACTKHWKALFRTTGTVTLFLAVLLHRGQLPASSDYFWIINVIALIPSFVFLIFWGGQFRMRIVQANLNPRKLKHFLCFSGDWRSVTWKKCCCKVSHNRRKSSANGWKFQWIWPWIFMVFSTCFFPFVGSLWKVCFIICSIWGNKCLNPQNIKTAYAVYMQITLILTALSNQPKSYLC